MADLLAPARPSRRGRSIVALTLAALPVLALLVGLGVWQLERLHWKEGLLHDVATRVHAPPVPAPAERDWPGLKPDAVEYRHVTLTGTYRHGDELHVFTTIDGTKGPATGPGYWVMTPLVTDEGGTVWVNRGFVPRDKRDPATRPGGQLPGRVTVTGLVRWAEPRSIFMPADVPAHDNWFVRDPAAFSAAKHLARTAPFFVDAEGLPPGGLPQGGETRLDFPNNHLGYAFTWFGLAASLVGVWAVMAWRRLRVVARLRERTADA